MAKDLQIFQVNNAEFRALDKFYRRAPKQFGRASAAVLNEFAFKTKDEAADTIAAKMIVRDPRFVKSKIRVNKARVFDPLRSQQSEVGSIEGKRFTGWEEQETGKQADRTRTATALARKGGSKKGQIRGPARLKPTNDFEEPKDYPGKNAHHKAVVMMQMLGRKKGRKKPFKMYGHRRMKPGLYKFGRGRRGRQRIEMLQRFKDKDARKIRRVTWLRDARESMFRSINMQATWAKALRRVLKLK